MDNKSPEPNEVPPRLARPTQIKCSSNLWRLTLQSFWSSSTRHSPRYSDVQSYLLSLLRSINKPIITSTNQIAGHPNYDNDVPPDDDVMTQTTQQHAPSETDPVAVLSLNCPVPQCLIYRFPISESESCTLFPLMEWGGEVSVHNYLNPIFPNKSGELKAHH